MAAPPRKKRPTILDVARLAGVSHTTVSFVINEVAGASISAATRARVREAIAQLDFHPHAGARSIGRRASQVIGVAIPEANNPHYHEIVGGIEAYCEQHGYSVFLAITNFDANRERRCVEMLKQQRIDGLILIPSHGDLLHGLRSALSQGYPIVTLGIYDNDVDNVRPELDAGEQQAIEHLVALGHRRIGYIYGVADHAAFGYRLEACLRIQRQLALPVRPAWVRRCGPWAEDGYRAAQALLADCAGPDRPTALVVVNDVLAIAVIAALHHAQLRVPHDMSVVSFDNTRQAEYSVYPPLASVGYEARQMGEQAARMIVERLADPDRAPTQLIMRAQLVVRASTGPALA